MAQETKFKPVLKNPIEITPESVRNANLRKIRVTNRLDLEDLSNLHMQVSASVEAQENTVLALVDRALRVNGLVPSWVIDETVTRDEPVKADGVFLERICGAETFFQLQNTRYLLLGFKPAVYLINGSGEIEPAVECDLSKLHLSDYSKLVIGVRFTPIEAATVVITLRWAERYQGLSEGDVELFPLTDENGRQIVGAYSLTDGFVEVQASDISKGERRLKTVYSKDEKRIHDYPVGGDSLIAVVDRRFDGRPMYRASDTYLDGELHKPSNAYMVTLPGLELAFLREFKIADPRDIGILIETEEKPKEKGTNGRVEPGQGRLGGNEVKAQPGMKYDVVVMAQGVYDRTDFQRVE